MNRKFLALIGSPRPNSTSSHLAQYLLDGLAARAGRRGRSSPPRRCARRRSGKTWRPPSARRTPSPSSPRSTWTAYRRSLWRPSSSWSRPARAARLYLRMVNCGLIEVLHNDVALDIYRLFARNAGLHWAGGLAIGGGGMFAGEPLKEQGGAHRHITTAFDQTIAALDAGQDIPRSATTGIRQRAIPAWAYSPCANLSMLIARRRTAILLKIKAQPSRPEA